MVNPFRLPLFFLCGALLLFVALPFLFFDSKAEKELAKRREERFLKALDVTAEDFWETEVSYREAHIPRATGGHRTLHVPTDDLKSLQKKSHVLWKGITAVVCMVAPTGSLKAEG